MKELEHILIFPAVIYAQRRCKTKKRNCKYAVNNYFSAYYTVILTY